MGKMKANRKFKGEEAVSAVIGVILMVAITVAIAATVFVYVSGMLVQPTTGKTVQAAYQELKTGTGVTGKDLEFKVTFADAGIPWADVDVTWSGGSCGQVNSSVTPYATAMAGNIAVGQYFTVDVNVAGTYTLDFIYNGKIIYTSGAILVAA
jgi:flagellin-like protein